MTEHHKATPNLDTKGLLATNKNSQKVTVSVISRVKHVLRQRKPHIAAAAVQLATILL